MPGKALLRDSKDAPVLRSFFFGAGASRISKQPRRRLGKHFSDEIRSRKQAEGSTRMHRYAWMNTSRTQCSQTQDRFVIASHTYNPMQRMHSPRLFWQRRFCYRCRTHASQLWRQTCFQEFYVQLSVRPFVQRTCGS